MPTPEPAFPFSVSEEAGRTTVRFPAGTALSEANAEALSRHLTALLEGKERPHLLIDLGGVTLLNSIMLAKFIGLNGRLRAAGGRLTLFNPNTIVRDVFRVTRLDTLLEVHAFSHTLPA
ncbi:MAG: STAS domain-containing protein [Planctomycetes bacterium]|nr:STAS domain-containing protein [Planctomycetota bacterium]